MRKILLSAFLSLIAMISIAVPTGKSGFEIGEGCFMLNGDTFQIKAAELHYPRIPRPYWEHRIKMCKALGMNTVCLYVFWNVHEPQPGEFDFIGQNDLREFIRLCDANDMKVILRPGPYVCAEWEMGGLPWWLLRDKDINLRTSDPRFMQRVAKFQKAVAAQVADLTDENGGPIIMVQVENEYGSYGVDKQYVSEIRDILRECFGNVVMFQCDWESNFLDNGLEDLLWTMNFGTGADINHQFAKLREVRPDSPLMCSEFWSGWFDKWGATHETRSATDMIAGINDMLDKNISFSLYMTHGGTNWGHWAGANSPGFAPDVTSYDYDAPINEYGRPTEKYYLLRNLMKQYAEDKTLPEIPDSISTIAIDKFLLTEVAPLFDNLPQPKSDYDIRTMEEYGIGYGSILYRTTIPRLNESAILTVNEPHDYARIYIDGEYMGNLDRRLGEKEITLPATSSPATLDILIEAMGRINFGKAIKDFKGITEGVSISLDGEKRELKDWQIYCLRDDFSFYDAQKFVPVSEIDSVGKRRLPEGVYRGYFNVDRVGDTFLDFSAWGKGLVYVNGYPLGRIWHIGPQQTLYMPGCWLREGENEIMVLDIIGPESAVVEGKRAPIIDKLQISADPISSSSEFVMDSQLSPVTEGEFPTASGWQDVVFPSARRGRYFCLEAIDAFDDGAVASVAEIRLYTPEGNELPRENWRVAFVDSEDNNGVNRTADKAFDLQESTRWETAPSSSFPHKIVIDLNDEYMVGAMRYFPGMNENAPGAIRSYRVFLF